MFINNLQLCRDIQKAMNKTDSFENHFKTRTGNINCDINNFGCNLSKIKSCIIFQALTYTRGVGKYTKRENISRRILRNFMN